MIDGSSQSGDALEIATGYSSSPLSRARVWYKVRSIKIHFNPEESVSVSDMTHCRHGALRKSSVEKRRPDIERELHRFALFNINPHFELSS